VGRPGQAVSGDWCRIAEAILTITALGIIGTLTFDLFHVRSAHLPTLREAAVWSAAYVGSAMRFGIALLDFGGSANKSTSPVTSPGEARPRSTTCSSS
jgi:hypothetical protein